MSNFSSWKSNCIFCNHLELKKIKFQSALDFVSVILMHIRRNWEDVTSSSTGIKTAHLEIISLVYLMILDACEGKVESPKTNNVNQSSCCRPSQDAQADVLSFLANHLWQVDTCSEKAGIRARANCQKAEKLKFYSTETRELLQQLMKCWVPLRLAKSSEQDVEKLWTTGTLQKEELRTANESADVVAGFWQIHILHKGSWGEIEASLKACGTQGLELAQAFKKIIKIMLWAVN